MKSEELGARTSQVEVANISKQGFWLLLGDRELFLSFKDFPWFEDAPIAKILKVEWPQADHLYWPDLDIDLELESILNPGRYPLISREWPVERSQPTGEPGRGRRKRTAKPPRRGRVAGR